MKQRYGFVSNSSSSSFIIACDKSKRNDEDIKFEMKVRLSEISDEIITTKKQLDEYFKESYGYSSFEEMYESTQEKYTELLSLIKSGKKLFMCSASSEDGDAKQAAIRECGEGHLILPEGFEQIGEWNN